MRARYRDVFGSADLELEALPDGFSERLILEERPTEAPVYRFRLRTEGLTADVASGERLRLRDSAGNVFALAFPARMWGAERDPATGEPKRSAPLDIEVRDTADGQVLEIRPDQGFLSDPDVKLPITVDPTVSLGIERDTFVATGGYQRMAFGDDDWLRVGGHVAYDTTRSYVDFPTGSLSGKNVLSAKLRLHQDDAGSCTATSFQAHRVTEYWQQTTATWDTQPASDSYVQGSLSTNKGGGSACPAASVSMPLSEPLVQGWADGRYPNYGVMLRATGDETASNSLKTFASADHPTLPPPYLDVSYNSYPATPSYRSPGSETAPGPELGDATPTFSARFSDPDGGTGKVQYQVFDATTNELVRDTYGATVSSGAQSDWTPTTPLPDHKRYYWRARGYDGQDYSRSWSTNVYFSVNENDFPAVPSGLSPSDGSQSESPDITLSGSFADSDSSGKLEFELREQSTGRLVSSGAGATVASGQASSWRVPPAVLRDHGRYEWRARGFDGVGRSSWTTPVALRTAFPESGDLDHFSFERFDVGTASLQVNIANGNLLLRQGDLNLPEGSLPFDLERSYNSRSVVGGLPGERWNLNVANDVRLEERVDLNGAVQLRGLSGGAKPLFRQGSGEEYLNPSGYEGRLTKIPDGWRLVDGRSSQVYSFNAAGQVVEIVDFDGAGERMRYTRDAAGRVLSLADESGHGLQLGYTPTGSISEVSGPGMTARYEYDGAGRLAAYIDPDGKRTSFGYDGAGNLGSVTASDGATARVTYDGLRRVQSATVSPAGGTGDSMTSFAYGGGRTVVTRPGSRKVTHEYGSDLRVDDTFSDAGRPTLSLSGALLEANGQSLAEGEYPLLIDASDGAPAEATSGVESVEVFVDGAQEDLAEQLCAADQCDLSHQWTFHTDQHPAGEYDITVVARDSEEDEVSKRIVVRTPEAADVETPAEPQPTAEQERNEALSFRTLLGLNAETEFVDGMLSASSRDRATELYGTPLTSSEQTEIVTRQAELRRQVPEINEYGDGVAPGSFAGAYADQDNGGLLYVGFTEDAESRLDDLRARVPYPERLRPFPAPPTSSKNDLDDLRERVTDGIPSLEEEGINVTSVVTNIPDNAVQVGVDNPLEAGSATEGGPASSGAPTVPDAAQVLQQRYGDEILLVRAPEQQPAFVGAPGPAVHAGLAIFSPGPAGGQCTAGFSATRGTAHGVLTAGHCGTVGFTNWFEGGRYLGRHSRENDSFDTAWIRTSKARSSTLVFGGLTAFARVTSKQIARRQEYGGQVVCISGASAGGVSCGELAAIGNVRVAERPGGPTSIYRNQRVALGAFSEPGDSGGPIFEPIRPGFVRAVGGLSAGGAGCAIFTIIPIFFFPYPYCVYYTTNITYAHIENYERTLGVRVRTGRGIPCPSSLPCS